MQTRRRTGLIGSRSKSHSRNEASRCGNKGKRVDRTQPSEVSVMAFSKQQQQRIMLGFNRRKQKTLAKKTLALLNAPTFNLSTTCLPLHLRSFLFPPSTLTPDTLTPIIPAVVQNHGFLSQLSTNGWLDLEGTGSTYMVHSFPM